MNWTRSTSAAATLVVLLGPAVSGCGGGSQCDLLCPDGSNSKQIVIDVAVADFNGDGQPDVALPVSLFPGSTGYLSVMLHVPTTGKGYLPTTDYSMGFAPASILAADLDGDGRPDIVLTDSTAGRIAILLNDAATPGAFTVAQTLSIPALQNVATVDLDGDGRPDLVMTSGADLSIQYALQNPGAPGTFAAPVELSKGSSVMAVGDLDGNGAADLVTATLTQVQVVFLTPGAAGPTVKSISTICTLENGVDAIAVTDVDGDGRADVVIVDPVAQVLVVLLQDPNAPGTFLPPRKTALTSSGGSLVVADLDGDGRPDVVIGADDAVIVLLQDAAHPGEFLAPTVYSAPFAAAVAVADIDGDGHPDIVTTTGVSQTVVGGVARQPPGVLYQNAAHPGQFLPLQDLK